MKRYKKLGFGLAVLAICGAVTPAAAKTASVRVWNVQCFLAEAVGKCKPGDPVRFQIKAFTPKQARDIANTAGEKSNKWKRCFKISRNIKDIPVCNPQTGQTIR
jgi:hypothetical protein